MRLVTERVAKQTSKSAAPAPQPALHDKRRKILIIDGDINSIESARYRLQQAGYRVATHTASIGMVAAVAEERPDLVLLEINRPAIDVPALCQSIRKTRPGVPIVLYSSINEKRLARLAIQCEADGYVVKNSSCDKLVYTVAQFLPNGFKLFKSALF